MKKASTPSLLSEARANFIHLPNHARARATGDSPADSLAMRGGHGTRAARCKGGAYAGRSAAPRTAVTPGERAVVRTACEATPVDRMSRVADALSVAVVHLVILRPPAPSKIFALTRLGPGFQLFAGYGMVVSRPKGWGGMVLTAHPRSPGGWVCQQAGGYGLEVGCARVPYHTPQKVRTRGNLLAKEMWL